MGSVCGAGLQFPCLHCHPDDWSKNTFPSAGLNCEFPPQVQYWSPEYPPPSCRIGHPADPHHYINRTSFSSSSSSSGQVLSSLDHILTCRIGPFFLWERRGVGLQCRGGWQPTAVGLVLEDWKTADGIELLILGVLSQNSSHNCIMKQRYLDGIQRFQTWRSLYSFILCLSPLLEAGLPRLTQPPPFPSLAPPASWLASPVGIFRCSSHKWVAIK